MPNKSKKNKKRHAAFIGSDPGNKGYFCLVCPKKKHVEFFPNNSEPLAIMEWLWCTKKKYKVQVVLIEKVHAIYGSSAGASFTFGRSAERVEFAAQLSQLPVELIQPKQWQKLLGVPVGAAKSASGKKIPNGVKKATRGIIKPMYPNVILEGPKGGVLFDLSDALAIAHVARIKYNL